MFLICPKDLGEQQPKVSPRHWVICSNNPCIHHLPVSYFTPWTASLKKSRVLIKNTHGNSWKPVKMHGPLYIAGTEMLKRITSFQKKFLWKLSFLGGKKQRQGNKYLNWELQKASYKHDQRWKVTRWLPLSPTSASISLLYSHILSRKIWWHDWEFRSMTHCPTFDLFNVKGPGMRELSASTKEGIPKHQVSNSEGFLPQH